MFLIFILNYFNPMKWLCKRLFSSCHPIEFFGSKSQSAGMFQTNPVEIEQEIMKIETFQNMHLNCRDKLYRKLIYFPLSCSRKLTQSDIFIKNHKFDWAHVSVNLSSTIDILFAIRLIASEVFKFPIWGPKSNIAHVSDPFLSFSYENQ